MFLNSNKWFVAIVLFAFVVLFVLFYFCSFRILSISRSCIGLIPYLKSPFFIFVVLLLHFCFCSFHILLISRSCFALFSYLTLPLFYIFLEIASFYFLIAAFW
jgi:hypothetical protein